MSEYQISMNESKEYSTMLDFLIQILPLDLIQYVIKYYIYEFAGLCENLIPLSISAYGCICDLNQNEFVICFKSAISHYNIKENIMYSQNITNTWGMVSCITVVNRKVIILYGNGSISIYNIDNHTEILDVALECRVTRFMVKLFSNFETNENLVIASNTIIYLLDIKTLKCTRINDKFETAITSLTACNNGNVVFTGADSRVQVWNPYTQTLVQILNNCANWTAQLLTFPDTDLIASIRYDNQYQEMLIIWGPSGNIIYSKDVSHISYVITLSDNKIAISKKNFIKIYSIVTKEILCIIDHGSKIDYLSKTLDNKLVVLTKFGITNLYNLHGERLIKLGNSSTNSVKVLTNGKIITTHIDTLVPDYSSMSINIWK